MNALVVLLPAAPAGYDPACSFAAAFGAQEQFYDLIDRVTLVGNPRTTGLLRSGLPKLSHAVTEEAAEVAVELSRTRIGTIIRENRDLLHHGAASHPATAISVERG